MRRNKDNDFADEVNSSNEINNLNEASLDDTPANDDTINENYAGNMKQFEEQEEITGDYSNVVYDDNEENNFKLKEIFIKNKLIFMIIGLILLLLIIFFLIRGCVSTKNVSIKKLTIDTDEIIYINEESKVQAKVTGSGKLSKTIYNFTISDDKIATLKNDQMKGKSVTNTIKPLASGEFTLDVIARINDTELKGSKSLVICKRLNKESLNLDTLTLKKGQKFSLNANVNLGIDKCYKNVSYSTKETDIISINEENIATANKVGSATIIVTNGTDNYTFVINVIEGGTKVTGINLNKTKTSLLIGKTEKITATISPSDASIKDVNWTSANEAIATVTNGTIKGIGSGTTTITATTVDGNYKAAVTVTVTNGKLLTKPGTSLCLKPTYTGKSIQITTITKQTGYTLSNYKQTNAGTYTITATLVEGYTWSDGTTKNITFKCPLNKTSASSSVTILGINRVNSTLTASVKSSNAGSRIYKWWYQDSANGTKTIITTGTTSSFKLTSTYLGKYIGVTVAIAENTNYKASTCSDITDKSNNSLEKVGEEVIDVSKYLSPTSPTITATDKIASGSWHNKNTTLNFSGSTISNNLGTVVYYYGTSESAMTSVGTTTGTISTLTNSTGITYYVKACNSNNLKACSAITKYVLKLDTTAPVITYTLNNANSSSYKTVWFYCKDTESSPVAMTGWWKKSTTSTWQKQWPEAWQTYVYFNLISSGTHNTSVRCENSAGLITDRDENFYVSSSGTSSSGGSSSGGSSSSSSSSSSGSSSSTTTTYYTCIKDMSESNCSYYAGTYSHGTCYKYNLTSSGYNYYTGYGWICYKK